MSLKPEVLRALIAAGATAEMIVVAVEADQAAEEVRKARQIPWVKLRQLAFDRDGEVCTYCGCTDGPFVIDHIRPRVDGGENVLDNVCVACRSCNAAKRDRQGDDWEKIRERRRRDRNRKRRKSAEIRGNPPDVAETLPRKERSPGPPKETQPPKDSDPVGSVSDAPTQRRFSPSKGELDAIWEITPRLGRERSSRRDLDRALTAAMRRGHTPAEVLAGVTAAYASKTFGGDLAKGVHRLIENDRWQSFTEAIAGLSNVVPLDPAQLAERQRLIAEWAEQQAAESHA